MEINEKKDRVLPFNIQWYHAAPHKDEYHFFVEPIWGAYVQPKDKTKVAVEEYLEDSLKKHLKTDFIKYEVTSVRRAIIKFKTDKWMRENFLKNPKVKYDPPRTLIWSFKKQVPDLVTKHLNWFELERFLRDKFKQFLKDHKKKVFEDKLKLMKKLNMDWFDFEFDLKMKKIYVRMKVSVMMTFAVGAYAVSDYMGKDKDVDSFKRYDL